MFNIPHRLFCIGPIIWFRPKTTPGANFAREFTFSRIKLAKYWSSSCIDGARASLWGRRPPRAKSTAILFFHIIYLEFPLGVWICQCCLSSSALHLIIEGPWLQSLVTAKLFEQDYHSGWAQLEQQPRISFDCHLLKEMTGSQFNKLMPRLEFQTETTTLCCKCWCILVHVLLSFPKQPNVGLEDQNILHVNIFIQSFAP
jgi:hypothetical protein